MCRGCEEDVVHLVSGMLVHMDDPDAAVRTAVCEVCTIPTFVIIAIVALLRPDSKACSPALKAQCAK